MNFKNLFYYLVYSSIFILAYTLLIVIACGCGMKNSDKEKKPIIVLPSNGGFLDRLQIEELCYDGVVYLINNVNSNKFSSVKFKRNGRIETCDGDK